jgi:MtN3 and saliva related transmembrane protein
MHNHAKVSKYKFDRTNMKETLKTVTENVKRAYGIYRFLEQAPGKAKNAYGIYMTFIGICSQVFFYLQAYKIFKHHSAENLSFYAFLIALVCSLHWLLYGMVIRDKPIFVSNMLGCVGISLNIIGMLIYSH